VLGLTRVRELLSCLTCHSLVHEPQNPWTLEPAYPRTCSVLPSIRPRTNGFEDVQIIRCWMMQWMISNAALTRATLLSNSLQLESLEKFCGG
jgi:hypothetical protein